jgi:hypothetical protein
VTISTVLLHQVETPILDPNNLGIRECESEGMAETVLGFHQVFLHQRMGSVATVARNKAMARNDPGIIIIAHDMTINARQGIVGKVGVTARVQKGEAAQADQYSDGEGNRHGKQIRPPHGLESF